MIALSALLESFQDGQDVLVQLKNGNVYLLHDFEMVDESIYDRNDVVMATIGEVISSSFPYRKGTLLELELDDIANVLDPITGTSHFSIPSS